MRAFALGPFDVLSTIGRGGMGAVYLAIHRSQKTEVAVKVLSPGATHDPRGRAAFRDEIRSVAALHHRRIVQVFDLGEVTEEASIAARGRVVTGTPYFAMEYVAGTAGAGLRRDLNYPRLQRMLLQLLDGLAHAHARGIIHLDLKPGNILSSPSEGFKLTDFGIAHVLDRGAPEEGRIYGTPAYMAPEQIRGEWRQYGPWTDLYALGCTTWDLSTGAAPFGTRTTRATLRDHLQRAPPPFYPTIPVVHGLEDWLRLLLSKDPRHRPQCAADAAWHLLGLGDVVGAAAWPMPVRVESLPTAVTERPVRAQAMGGSPALRPLPPAVQPPPFPWTWRRPEPPRFTHLAGVGLGLYGLRTVPLVGREAERDLIWDALREVVERGLPRSILLIGCAGSGKTRLAEWMCERALELGIARSMRATHGEHGEAGEGLAPMLGRACRSQDLTGQALANRLEEVLGSAPEVAELSELLWPATQEDRAAGRVRTPPLTTREARHRVVLDVLGRLAAQRPLLVCLDDIQWGDDSQAFAKRLLAAPIRVLLILTARSEAVDRVTAERLRGLASTTLEIGRLEAESSRQLVSELLGLPDALAGNVAARSEGNPLFAIQLVGDWVRRGVLKAHAGGFSLHGPVPEIPGAIHELWCRRLALLLDQRPPTDRSAVEIAAALGQAIQMDEWDEACEEAGVPRSVELLECLLAAGLVRHETDGHCRFAHGMLVESVVRVSREEQRWDEIARHSGATLLRRGTSTLQARPLIAEAYLQRALARLESVDALGTAQAWVALGCARNLLGRLDEAARDLAQGLAAARALGAHELVADALAELATVHKQQGQIQHSLALYEEALVAYAKTDASASAGRAAGAFAVSLQLAGRHEEATAQFANALVLVRDAGEVLEEARILDNLGTAAAYRGDLEAAARLKRQAKALAGEDGLAAIIQSRLAAVLVELGLYEEARPAAEEALALHREAGRRTEAAHTLMNLGTLCAETADYEHAMRYYRSASEIFDDIGNRVVGCVARVNYGELCWEMGRHQEARDVCASAAQEARQLEVPMLEGGALGCFAETLAMLGEQDGARASMAQAFQVIRSAGHAPQLGHLYCRRGRVSLLAGGLVEARADLASAREIADAAGGREHSPLRRDIASLERLLNEHDAEGAQ